MEIVPLACCLLLFASLPGAPPLDPLVARKLDSAWAARPAGYKPRTRHLNPDGSPQFTNRLFLESSPYLLQHAHNPVNWYPWGAEAFDTARKLGRPVLLSVGYSTCHWCHVMEEESFEDLEIARYLNVHYVTIKVDREERPDIDAIYMAAVQSLAGGGGWPMTVWLTPDRKPFYGGTYFPARDGDRGVSTGFLTLLRKLQGIYSTDPARVATSAAEITRVIEQSLAPKSGSALPQARVLHTAVQLCRSNFDSTYGGTAGAPKFPSSLPIRFLLRYHRRTGDAQALRMATLTLEKMAAGGMYDQVGGGFHRYSTDARWLAPHFEKMLYDNALLAVTYLEAYQVTGRQDFARIAREILRYLERDMSSPQGAFYSATDADSPTPAGTREEGYFFTWTPKEIEAVLGPERARAVNTHYGVTPQGNFPGGRSILHVAAPATRPVVEQSRHLLYRARLKRPSPLRDEKILTSWNGLALSAYARASLVLGEGEPRYAARAARAADFLAKNLRRNGRLLRSFKDGQARHNAYLDDYAFLIAGLLDLYEVTGDIRWLAESIDLDRVLEKHYEDAQNGGYFLTSDDHERLLAREKPAYDGAEPSGNSVQVLNLLRLSEFTTQDRYRQRAERALKFFSSILNAGPASLSEMLLALDFHLDTPKEIVIAAPSTAAAEPLLARLRSTFLPNRILALVSPGRDPSKLIPLVENKLPLKGKATAYVCEKRVCELPTTDPEVFAKQLRKTKPLERQ